MASSEAPGDPTKVTLVKSRVVSFAQSKETSLASVKLTWMSPASVSEARFAHPLKHPAPISSCV